MVKRILVLISIICSVHLNAQTGIGTTTPHASAKLEVAATNKGFLPPRVTLSGTNDISTISSPATGLVVFNTATAGTTPNNVLPGYYYYDGTKWNQLVDQSSLNSFSGFNPNYAQSNASAVSKSAVGDIIVSQSITTSGRPVQIIATGDANPANNGAWVQLQLYRDGTAIGKKVQAESSSSNENVPYCLNFIDNPTTPGTYTYSVRIVGGGAGGFGFGESDGNHITLLELGAWSAGTMPVSKGGTGVTTSTGSGNTVLSNSPTLETITVSSGNTQFPSSINITPTTHATSKRAAMWLDGWGIMQDILGNGTKNFSISQTYGGTYPPRLFINPEGNIGIGTSAPDASAILDISSTTKGIVIPRMTSAQRNAIVSPTTGLLIYQTDASTGFYFYNGSSWMSVSEPNWTSAGTIQSVGWGATTTAPIIGSATINDYSYKQIGANTWKCKLTYSAGGSSTGVNIGSGDYLFTLPNGLQFNTSIAGQEIYNDLVGSSSWNWPGRWLSNSSGSITNLSQGGLLYVVPYSSTQFRLIHVGIAGVGYVIPYASGYYGVGGNLSWRVTFTFQSL
jgi:hypothetical protein